MVCKSSNDCNYNFKTSDFDQCLSNSPDTSTDRCKSLNSVVDSATLISARNLSDEIIQSIKELETLKFNVKKDILNLMSSAKKEDNYAHAFGKLCAIVLDLNEKMFALQNDTQEKILRVLALKQDQEVDNEFRDRKISSNLDSVQSIEMASSCENDLCKVFITFTCSKELNNLKSSKNLISDTKDILARMNIDVDKFGIMPIKNVKFQHIKVFKSFEQSLCVSFTNSNIASFVRHEITSFNKDLNEKGKLNEMRYCCKVYWSKNVWKMLKICYELKRLKLVDRVRVCRDGIIVNYTVISTSSADKSLKWAKIKCLNDINILRRQINDIYSDISCEFLYDDNYFMLNGDERDYRRLQDGDMFKMARDSYD